MTPGERKSLVLALALMVYGLMNRDVPLLMLTCGYFAYTLRHAVAAGFGGFAGQIVRVFGLTLCVGAFILALFF